MRLGGSAHIDSEHVIQYQTTLADGGDPNAQVQLGLIHGEGLYGNEINFNEAFRRYAQAGNQKKKKKTIVLLFVFVFRGKIKFQSKLVSATDFFFRPENSAQRRYFPRKCFRLRAFFISLSIFHGSQKTQQISLI